MASSNYQAEKRLISTARDERERTKAKEGSEAGLRTHLILVNNPALSLFIISIVAIALFGNIVNGHVLQAGVLGDLFTMDCLANARGASDYDVGSSAHGGEDNMCQCRMVTSNQNGNESVSYPVMGVTEFWEL